MINLVLKTFWNLYTLHSKEWNEKKKVYLGLLISLISENNPRTVGFFKY